MSTTLLMDPHQMQPRKIVVTTTNEQRLEGLVGPVEAIENVGKPHDLTVIVDAVKKAVGDA